MANDPKSPQDNPNPNPPLLPSPRELELEALLKKQEAEIQELKEVPADAAAAAVAKLKKDFKLPEGEGHLTHVVETRVNGVPLTAPRLNVYDPGQYKRMIVNQPGYSADIVHAGKK